MAFLLGAISRFCPLAPTATTSEPGGRDDCAIVSPLDDLTLKFTDLLIVTELSGNTDRIFVQFPTAFKEPQEFREDYSFCWCSTTTGSVADLVPGVFVLSDFDSFAKGGGMAAVFVSVLTSEAIIVLLSSTFLSERSSGNCFTSFSQENSNDKISIGINLFTYYSFVKNKLMASRLVKLTANLQ